MPNLFIDIEGRFAQFNDALVSIRKSTETAAQSMQRSFNQVRGTIASISGALAALGVGVSLKGIVDAADQLNTFSERTDISVKNLQGLTFAAGQFDVEAESLIGSIQRLGRSISEAGTDPNGEKASLFKTLGLDEAAKGTQDALAAFKQLADVFPRLRDADQSRVAMELLGRSAAELKGLFKTGSEGIQTFIDEGNRLNPVTGEFAKKADAFNDELKKVQEAAKGAGIALLDDLLPPLTRVLEKIKEAASSKSGAGTGFGDLFGDFVNRQINDLLGTPLADLEKQLTDSNRFLAELRAVNEEDTFAGAFRRLLGKENTFGVEEKIRALEGRIKAAKNALRDSVADVVDPLSGAFTPVPQDIIKLPNKDSDAIAKKQLDAQLKDFKRFADERVNILKTNTALEEVAFKDNLTTFQAFADARNDAQRESTRVLIEEQNKSINALRSFKPKDEAGRIDIQEKISDAIAKRTKIEQDASVTTAKNASDDKKQYEAFLDKIKEVNSAIQERQGQAVEATGARFDVANKDFRERLEVQRRDTDLASLARLRELTVAQAGINQLEEDAGIIRTRLAGQEARADIAFRTGANDEIKTLKEISAARLGAVAELEQIADRLDKVAESSGDPRQLSNARAFRVEVEKLASSADLLRDKMQNIFTGEFTSIFDKIIDKTVTFKQLLASIPQDLAKQLARAGVKNVADSLFSKEGTLGGVVTGASNFIFGTNRGTPFPANAGPQPQSASSDVGEDPEGAAFAASLNQASVSADSTATSLGGLSQAAATVAAANSEQAANMGILGIALQALTLFTNLASSAEAKKAAVSAATTGSAKGNIFTGGIGSGSAKVIPFARGGVFDRPFAFSLADGSTGIGSEAGAEAIMPLTRDSSGRLGVRASGGGMTVLQTINFQNNGQPVDRRSQSQVAAAAYRGAQSASRSTS